MTIRPHLINFIILLSTSACTLYPPFDTQHSIHFTQNIILAKSNYIQVATFNNDKKRKQGLMNINSLKQNTGGLFIYQKPQHVSYWMKNTLIPLDILFFDKNKRLVKIIHSAKPCKSALCQRYTADQIQYVLELNAGFCTDHQIAQGDYFKEALIKSKTYYTFRLVKE